MNPDARPQCARRGGLRYNPRKNLDRRRPIAQADTEHQLTTSGSAIRTPPDRPDIFLRVSCLRPTTVVFCESARGVDRGEQQCVLERL